MSDEKLTCASCQHIGIVYHSTYDRYDHMCAKSNERRVEEMPKGADFFDHFRAFFDARHDQKACRHYVERPIANEEILSLLRLMAEQKGRGEFKFFSEENLLAGKLDRKFVTSDIHAKTSAPGNRVFWLLPIGKDEVARATTDAST